MKKLARLLTKYESGKKQVDIAQMSEILRKLAVLAVVQDPKHKKAADEWDLYLSRMIQRVQNLRAEGHLSWEILDTLMKPRRKK